MLISVIWHFWNGHFSSMQTFALMVALTIHNFLRCLFFCLSMYICGGGCHFTEHSVVWAKFSFQRKKTAASGCCLSSPTPKLDLTVNISRRPSSFRQSPGQEGSSGFPELSGVGESARRRGRQMQTEGHMRIGSWAKSLKSWQPNCCDFKKMC